MTGGLTNSSTHARCHSQIRVDAHSAGEAQADLCVGLDALIDVPGGREVDEHQFLNVGRGVQATTLVSVFVGPGVSIDLSAN